MLFRVVGKPRDAPVRDGPEPDPYGPNPELDQAAFDSEARRLRVLLEERKAEGLEPVLGPLVTRLLMRRHCAGGRRVRILLLTAFAKALADAFDVRSRNAGGDYSPDPKSERFPAWTAPSVSEPPRAPEARPKVSLKGLVESWWAEAKKTTGRKPSTHESYRNSMAAFVGFLKHDDAGRVTAEDVVRFKDHRLSSINKRTGRPVSPKTVKDSDLADLKAVFGWVVSNRKMRENPANGITIKLRKVRRLRSKGFTDAEAQTILRAALSYAPRRNEATRTAAAKRWVPWLCAYTGARVGELAQVRKQDLRQEGGLWVLKITPECGPDSMGNQWMEKGSRKSRCAPIRGEVLRGPAKRAQVLPPRHRL